MNTYCPSGSSTIELEAEHVGVEALLAAGVADVQHRMVHPGDPHRASLLTVVAHRRGLMVRP